LRESPQPCKPASPGLFFLEVNLANPQKENGHTALANDIWDALAKYRLSGEEWKCLIVIIRKTYGWHKKSDRISLSQFSQIADMKKQSASRALKSLSAKRLIGISKNADRETLEYCFHKDFDKWEPISKKAYGKQKRLPPVSKIAKEPISENAEHKRNYTKETITKEILERFEIFWKSYPRRVAKPIAKKSFLKINPDGELFLKILSAIETQRKNWNDPKYTPHPSTWLNQERWNDEPENFNNHKPDCRTVSADFSSDMELMKKQMAAVTKNIEVEEIKHD
jgi:phage replication O-like protein O